MIFYKPIYDLLFIKNKILDAIWQLAAVSMAAQILTTPLSLYYFHQFPVYFLLSNLVVVPVSTVVLVATLVLVMLSPVKVLAVFIGSLLNGLIWWLNTFIERMEDFPLAVWSGISINLVQSLLLFISIAGIAFGLINQRKAGIWCAIGSLLIFFCIRTASFYNVDQQQKLVVYNANRYAAADIIEGRKYFFQGHPAILSNTSLTNYVLTPSRILHRVSVSDSLDGLRKNENAFLINGKKILFINNVLQESSKAAPVEADLVVLSGNPRLYISDLVKVVHTRQIVVDGSVPTWKARCWIKDCDSLEIPCHNVATAGAFVMSLH